MADARPRSAPVLATYGLTRNFGGLIAVRNVTVRLHQGELHAIIGPNGAGKTTLVNMLSGEIKPTAGFIELGGHEVAGAPAWRLTRLGVGRSFQRTNIFRPLTVLENVRLAAQAAHAPVRNPLRSTASETGLVKTAREALQRVGLGGADDRIAGALSHGEQRQLEIAMTLASSPKVLLLDEPLAGMGPEESQRMIALLKDLAREHAVLLIEHDMDFVFAVADWMTVMVEGAVLAEGKPEAIRANAAVQQAYLGGHA
jgi:ABC-type branched-subunit amino acid transport system ATPase component